MLPRRGSCPEGTEGVVRHGGCGWWASTPSGASHHLPLTALRAGGGWLLLALAACAPKPASHGLEPLTLDCSQPFAALAQRITGQPGLKAAPKDPGEPYRFYSTEDGATSYVVTEPGAPGHPAILMQTARNGTLATTGCPYGDKAGYGQLLAYLQSLRAARPTGATL